MSTTRLTKIEKFLERNESLCLDNSKDRRQFAENIEPLVSALEDIATMFPNTTAGDISFEVLMDTLNFDPHEE